MRALAKRMVAESARLLGTITSVATRERAVAFTFDDGPHPEDTPPLLDVLAERKARATFFLVGKSAARHPGLVGRLVTSGHALGNHSWDHPSFRLIKGRHRREQIRWCRDALAPHGATALFRPPFGEQTPLSRLETMALGYRVVCWDVIAEDWRDDPAEVMSERVRRRLRPGSIVLFHDTLYMATEQDCRDRRPMREAVGRLIDGLQADGYRFVTVPELLRLGRPIRAHWYWKLPRGYMRRMQ